MIYLDTCVLVACYYPEVHSAAAQRAVQNADQSYISPISEVEFCSAIALKIRTNQIEKGQAGDVIALFREHVSAGTFQILTVDSGVYKTACDWISIFKTSLRTLDALHLATAHLHQTPIVTSDKILATAAALLKCNCSFIGN